MEVAYMRPCAPWQTQHVGIGLLAFSSLQLESSHPVKHFVLLGRGAAVHWVDSTRGHRGMMLKV